MKRVEGWRFFVAARRAAAVALAMTLFAAPALGGRASGGSTPGSRRAVEEPRPEAEAWRPASGWRLEGGWREEDRPRGTVLVGSGHSWARLPGGEEWSDYAYRLRLQLTQGSIHLNFRAGEDGRYFIGFHGEGLYLKKESPWGEFTDLTASAEGYALGEPHVLEVRGVGGHLTVAVDGRVAIEYRDQDPLRRGGIALETLERSVAEVEGLAYLLLDREPEEPAFYEAFPVWNMPDLVVESLVAEPDRIAPGETAMLVARVANRGTGIADPSHLVFASGGEVLSRLELPALGAGQETGLRFAWEPRAPGRHLVEAAVLVSDESYDADHDNHRRPVSIWVVDRESRRADLQLAAPEVGLRASDEAVRLEFALAARNPGSAELEDVELAAFLDGERLGGRRVGRIEPGSADSERLASGDVDAGDHLLTVSVVSALASLGGVVSKHLVVPGATVLYDSPGQGKWASLGPRLISPGGPSGSSGRIHNIAFHPSNPKIVYASTPRGGLWVTTSGGDGWKPLGDKLPSMAGGPVALDPKHPQIVYYATWGGGLYKSTNGGMMWWSQPFAPDSLVGSVGSLVARYAPSGELVLYAAGSRGLWRYKSTDPWAVVPQAADWVRLEDSGIASMVVDPDNLSRVYVAVRGAGIYRTDNALTAASEAAAGWKHLQQGLPDLAAALPNNGTKSIQLDVHRADPRILYAAIAHPFGIDPIEQLAKLGIYRTTSRGDQWELVRSHSMSGLYNPFIRVHPKQPNLIYFGGVPLYKEDVSASAGKPQVVTGIHADQHAFVFDPFDSSRYWVGNDGGVWRLRVAAGGDTAVHRNFDLRTVELYDFDASRQSSQRMIAGTQDNGTLLWEGDPTWKMIRGGDGYHSLFAHTNDAVRYSQHQFLTDTLRWDPVAKKWKAANNGLPKGMPWYGAGAFITMHPKSPDYVLSQGPEVHVTTNGGASWDPRGPKGSNVKGTVRRVLVQPQTLTWVAGTSQGQIWTTSHGGSPWHSIFEHPFGASVRSMAFSSVDHKTLLVLFSGGPASARIWRLTMSPGPPETWSPSNITDNFPSNRDAIVISGDGHSLAHVYIGTDKGVFRWQDGKPTYDAWQTYNEGLPLARVNDLLVDPISKQLRAATQGRGAWAVLTGP